jgi:hypothetical protein
VGLKEWFFKSGFGPKLSAYFFSSLPDNPTVFVAGTKVRRKKKTARCIRKYSVTVYNPINNSDTAAKLQDICSIRSKTRAAQQQTRANQLQR